MKPLYARAEATQKTFDKFKAKPFDWNGATCSHVLRSHLRNMGKRPPKMPSFRSPIGAARALKEMGADDLAGLCRALGLVEIPPAMMVVGDIAILPGDEGRVDGIYAAIAICAGNKFMGWHEAGEGFQTVDDIMPHVAAAFRV